MISCLFLISWPFVHDKDNSFAIYLRYFDYDKLKVIYCARRPYLEV